MKLAVGCDHIGLELLKKIIPHLESHGYQITHCGTYDSMRTDYPIYAKKVAEKINQKECDFGILICGSGIGMSISANKIHGIRAVVCSEPYSAVASRMHNDSNILCMGSQVVGLNLALKIVDEWLETKYEGGRHQNRLEIIEDLEEDY